MKISFGDSWSFYYTKRDEYAKSGVNGFITLPFYPIGSLCAFIGDPETWKEVTNDRIRFPKPPELMERLRVYGLSVLTAEGEEWKRHRRISQPAFSDRNIRLVWKAATGVVEELIEEHWENKSEVRVEHALDITVQIALMVLSVAAFGKPMSWSTNETGGLSEGHKMSFTRVLYIVSSHLIGAMVAPSWSLIFTKKLREVRRAAKELRMYMDEMIAERKKEYEGDPEMASQRSDLLANLIAAAAEDQVHEDPSQENDRKKKDLSLNLEELRGNVFIYLMAGHETTAHTLTYLLGLLALHPEEQDKLYQQTREVLNGRRASYEDLPQLTRALAILYESLRMYPPVTVVAKKATQNSTLRVSTVGTGGYQELNVPKNAMVLLHAMRIHSDPRYYPEPEKFNPDRFMGNDWNKDAFLAFSMGARSCVGRKFTETELVAALTALISRYSIHLTDEMAAEFKDMKLSMAQKAERLLKSKVLLTTTPISVPLVFRKREASS